VAEASSEEKEEEEEGTLPVLGILDVYLELLAGSRLQWRQ